MEGGLILKPTELNVINMFVNSDFAGLWLLDDKLDLACVKSQIGCIITVAQCPVIWCSKLRTQTALSTKDTELYALSCYMRSVLLFK